MAAAPPVPKISATPASVNLGAVKLGASSALKVITVKNTGNSDLLINSVNITGTDSDDFSQTNNCGTIQPGESCFVNATFTPLPPYAKKAATLAIASNDPKKPLLNVKLSGQVSPPAIFVKPTSVNFGKLSAATANASKSVTVKNSGLSDLTINSIDISGADPGDFSTTSTCGTIQKGEDCTISIVFAPQVLDVGRSASLDISSNDPKKPTNSVQLAGSGSSPALLSIAVTPSKSFVAENASMQLKATGFYSDDTSKDLTALASWSSGTPGVASISTSGLAAGVAVGTTVIKAASGNISGKSKLTVTVSPIVGITPTFTTIQLPTNVPQTFTISNKGQPDSTMAYTVADDGTPAGILEVQNATGTLKGGQSSDIIVSVKPEYNVPNPATGIHSLVGATLVLDVYTPTAVNYVKFPVSVHISGAYSISGTVKDLAATGQPGAVVTLAGTASATALTDHNGFYQFNNLGIGSYTLTPSIAAVSNVYTPSSRGVNITNIDITGQDFVSPLPLLYGLYHVNYTWSETATGVGCSISNTGNSEPPNTPGRFECSVLPGNTMQGIQNCLSPYVSYIIGNPVPTCNGFAITSQDSSDWSASITCTQRVNCYPTDLDGPVIAETATWKINFIGDSPSFIFGP